MKNQTVEKESRLRYCKKLFLKTTGFSGSGFRVPELTIQMLISHVVIVVGMITFSRYGNIGILVTMRWWPKISGRNHS
jgi:hypothetical protein